MYGPTPNELISSWNYRPSLTDKFETYHRVFSMSMFELSNFKCNLWCYVNPLMCFRMYGNKPIEVNKDLLAGIIIFQFSVVVPFKCHLFGLQLISPDGKITINKQMERMRLASNDNYRCRYDMKVSVT
jgi:hypothetical protein